MSDKEFVQTKQGGEMFIFESVAEIAEYSDPTAYKWEDWGGRSFTFGEMNAGEDLDTYEKVKDRMQKDWAEGVYIFQQYVDKLGDAELPDVADKRRRTKFGSEGDDIDIDRMRSGDMNFWRSSERADSTGPTTMTVVIDTTTPSFQNSKDILWRGAAGVALAKILEAKGWSVEIWVVNGSKLYADERTPVYTACRLKRTSDPLDISTLINTVSGWFYRTATFTLITTICARRHKQVEYGFGNCATPTEEDLDLLTPDEYRVYSSGVYSFDGAFEVIKDQLEKIRNKAADESA